MEKQAVIFDTNSYRNIVSGKTLEETRTIIEDLRKLEDQKNVIQYGSVIVGMEMLAHLADDTGDDRQECLYGLIAYKIHCDDYKNGIRIFPHASLQILNSFLGGVPVELENRVRNMAGIIVELEQDTDTTLKKFKANSVFNDIKGYIENEEHTFSILITELIDGISQALKKENGKLSKTQLKNKIIDYFQNGSFEPYMAIAIILALASKYGSSLSRPECIKRAYDFNLRFPLAVGFYIWVARTIVNNKIDMFSKKSKKKRWNWLWDYNVTFALNDKLNGMEVIIVTADDDMKQIATEYGLGERIMNLEEYYLFLRT